MLPRHWRVLHFRHCRLDWGVAFWEGDTVHAQDGCIARSIMFSSRHSPEHGGDSQEVTVARETPYSGVTYHHEQEIKVLTRVCI